MRHRPMIVQKRRLLVVGAALVLAVGIPSRAVGSRPPTTAELNAIKTSISAQNGGVSVTLSFVSISTVAPGWAAIGSGSKPYSFSVFHRERTKWLLVGPGGIAPGEPFDGLCAYMLTPVVVDLFRIGCPSYPALHARRASSTIRKALTASLLADPTIAASDGGHPSRVRVSLACVSRLDLRWAAANVAFPDTGLIAWFHEIAGRWHVFLSSRLPVPPHAAVLSLASCTDYNAAEFGA